VTDSPVWYRRTPLGWTLSLHIQPGAKRNEVIGLHGEALKLRIMAPALEGRANGALETFVAERLGVAKSKVQVMKGMQSRNKVVAVNERSAQPEQLLFGKS
jgi:uncharacterized protein (TIGR00251 family)